MQRWGAVIAKLYRFAKGFAYLSGRRRSVAVCSSPPVSGGWLRLIALARSISRWASAGGGVQHGHVFCKVHGHVLLVPPVARDDLAQSRVGGSGWGPRGVLSSGQVVVEGGCSTQAGARGWGGAGAGAQRGSFRCGDIVPLVPP